MEIYSNFPLNKCHAFHFLRICRSLQGKHPKIAQRTDGNETRINDFQLGYNMLAPPHWTFEWVLARCPTITQ